MNGIERDNQSRAARIGKMTADGLYQLSSAAHGAVDFVIYHDSPADVGIADFVKILSQDPANYDLRCFVLTQLYWERKDGYIVLAHTHEDVRKITVSDTLKLTDVDLVLYIANAWDYLHDTSESVSERRLNLYKNRLERLQEKFGIKGDDINQRRKTRDDLQ